VCVCARAHVVKGVCTTTRRRTHTCKQASLKNSSKTAWRSSRLIEFSLICASDIHVVLMVTPRLSRKLRNSVIKVLQHSLSSNRKIWWIKKEEVRFWDISCKSSNTQLLFQYWDTWECQAIPTNSTSYIPSFTVVNTPFYFNAYIRC